MTRPLRPSVLMMRQRLSRGGNDRSIIHIKHGPNRNSFSGNRTTDGVETASGPKQTQDGTEGITLGDRARGHQGSIVDTTLKTDPPLLIDPNILTDNRPADRQTEVTHQLSGTRSRERVKTLGPVQTQKITVNSKIFDHLGSNTLNGRTAASGNFTRDVLTNPKLKAEVGKFETIPNPPESVQDRNRSGVLNGDGTIFRFARLGKGGHSGLTHLHRSTSGNFPTLRQFHKEGNGSVGKMRKFGTRPPVRASGSTLFSKDGNNVLSFKIGELSRMNCGETLTKMSSDLIFRRSMMILPEIDPILINESRSLTQSFRSTTLGIGD